MKREIDGLLIVDKPEGITSLDVVREIKQRLGVKKAGHIGTLDPFATGVLPIVLNEGTKLVPFLREGPKEYEVTLRLGRRPTPMIGRSGRPETTLGGSSTGKGGSLHPHLYWEGSSDSPMFRPLKCRGSPFIDWREKGSRSNGKKEK